MCDCVKKMNARLESHNARIAIACLLTDNKLSGAICVDVEKIDKSKRKPATPTVIATHCPFCGVKWEDK